MTIEQAVLERIKVLPIEKKQEVLDFTEFLYQKVKVESARNDNLIDGELSLLDENELTHLEMEFENYEQIYPRQ